MKTLEALAKATMDASEAQNRLQELKTEETEYVAEREGRAAAAVDRVVQESEEVLKQATESYRAATEIAGTVAGLSARINDVVLRVRKVMELFNEKSRLWEARTTVTEARLLEVRRAGEARKLVLDGQQKNLAQEEARLVDWEKDLASREDALMKDIAELNKN